MSKQQPEDINWKIRFSLVAIACTIIIAAVNLPYIIWQKRLTEDDPEYYRVMITLIHNLDFFDASLIVSALFCGLVTGFILTFAIVVMPGLGKLTDKDFLRAFQVTDEIIQNNQPLFMLIWVGSIISVITTIFTSIVYVGFPDASLTLLVCFIYLVGAQGVTIIIHIPLNNHVQKLQVHKLDDQAANQERSMFEARWNKFNYIRSSIGFFVCLAFLVILAQR